MGKANGLIRFLDMEEMQRLHEGALEILNDVGMKVDHPEALDYLEKVGCIVNRNSSIVLFPKSVVETAIRKMRKDFSLTDRQGMAMPMRYSQMHMCSKPAMLYNDFTVNAGGFPAYVLDLDGNRRMATMTDVTDSIRLADALENVDLIGLPCSAQEIPHGIRPVAMTAELIKNTSKPGGIEAWNRSNIKYIAEMASVLRGGREELRKKPFLVGYGETRSPLGIDSNMCEIFMEYIKMGLPQSLDTMPNAGATAPASSAGTLVLGLAETLLGLVLGYAIDENAMVSIDMNPSLIDVKSMIFPYAGADRIPLMSAANQMMSEFYGRPGGCHAGKTDACSPGVQAGFEKALSTLFPILTGATGIGTMGQLEGGITFSFVQLVIDNEIVGYIKRILKGFEVTEETLALDVIKDVGIGGNYLQHEHTAMNYRNEFYMSDLLERLPWGAWEMQEIRGLEEKAREKAKRDYP
jgi:trimethylamine---corrinoid protein Co-methyltransferase